MVGISRVRGSHVRITWRASRLPACHGGFFSLCCGELPSGRSRKLVPRTRRAIIVKRSVRSILVDPPQPTVSIEHNHCGKFQSVVDAVSRIFTLMLASSISVKPHCARVMRSGTPSAGAGGTAEPNNKLAHAA